ncbi:MAG: hypothetical protein IJH34_09465 [Romboutsia sp.]|nr:hypothetical protein [Romboutsia sp.]
MGKSRRSITIDDEIWFKLPYYIVGSRSAFFEEMARKQINSSDDIEKIELELQQLENEQNNIKTNISLLNEKKKQILEQRKVNAENKELIQDAMNTIRVASGEQRAIELNRVKLIASNHTLDYTLLLKEMEKENIKALDIEVKKDDLTGLLTR